VVGERASLHNCKCAELSCNIVVVDKELQMQFIGLGVPLSRIVLGLSFLTLIGCDSSNTAFTSKSRRNRNLKPTPTINSAQAVPAAFEEYEQEFDPKLIFRKELKWNLTDRRGEQGIVMSTNREHLNEIHTQNIRPLKTRIFSQGSRAEKVVESFTQKNLGILDVILVIDNSGSMADEQLNLSTKLLPLINKVAGSDWRIGILTTDARDGCLKKLFTHSDSQVEKLFEDFVANLGTSGSGHERGLFQAANALDCVGNNWIRPNSNIAVLIVSDEDECSNGACRRNETNGIDPLLSMLTSPPLSRELGKTAKIYGIISEPNTTCDSAYNVGNIYKQAVLATDGITGSICSNNYSPTLKRISKDLLNSLVMQFVLAEEPLNDDLNVYINGKKVESGIQLDGKTLTFSTPPPQNSQIEVHYNTTEDTTTQTYEIPANIDLKTFKVQIDGNPIAAKDYTIDQLANLIIFKENPPDRAEIKLEFLDSTGLKNTFQTQRPVIGDNIVVSIAGLKTKFFTYDSITNSVIFDNPPPDGSEIQFEYLILEEPILVYQLIASEGLEIKVRNQNDSDYMNVSLNNGSIEILPEDHSEQEMLIVEFEASPDSKELKLEHTPIESTISINEEGICPNGDAMWEYLDKTIRFNCISGEGQTILVGFDYIFGAKEKFEFTKRTISGNSIIEVIVNSVLTQNYTTAGQVITIPKLNYQDHVLVRLKEPN